MDELRDSAMVNEQTVVGRNYGLQMVFMREKSCDGTEKNQKSQPDKLYCVVLVNPLLTLIQGQSMTLRAGL